MPVALLDLSQPPEHSSTAILPTVDALGGVPLALWALRALRLVIDESDIVVAIHPEHRVELFKPFKGLTVSDPAAAGATLFERVPDGPDLMIQPGQPFCTATTATSALESPSPELARYQSSPIERIRVVSQSDLELAQAVATGLPPTHDAVRGIGKFAASILAGIQAVVTDVDGTLTDGAVYMPGGQDDVEVEPIRKFDTRDGQGIRMLLKHGIKVAVLSSTYRGASSRQRAAMLKVEDDLVDVGPGDKRQRFLALCSKMSVQADSVLYFGDDINDLPAMEEAGVVACPADAHPLIRQHADIVLESNGGHHAARELSDLVLAAKSADLAVAAQ